MHCDVAKSKDATPDDIVLGLNNQSISHMLLNDRWTEHKMSNFSDPKTGMDYAILSPGNIPDSIDYLTESFAVSTQCTPIRPADCRFNLSVRNDTGEQLVMYNCPIKNSTQIVHGVVALDHYYYIDFHRYIRELPPSEIPDGVRKITGYDCLTGECATLNEEDEVWKNPWYWADAVSLEYERAPAIGGEYVWTFEGRAHLMVTCKTTGQSSSSCILLPAEYLIRVTVHDVSFTSVSGRIQNIVSLKKSNGTVAGMASAPLYPHFGLIGTGLTETLGDLIDFQMSDRPVTMSQTINYFALARSRSYLSYIGSQLSPRPALRVQSRDYVSVTQVPKPALWTFIGANLLYILLAVVLGVMALWASAVDPATGQLQARLTIPGVVAELFEKPYSSRKVNSELGLF